MVETFTQWLWLLVWGLKPQRSGWGAYVALQSRWCPVSAGPVPSIPPHPLPLLWTLQSRNWAGLPLPQLLWFLYNPVILATWGSLPLGLLVSWPTFLESGFWFSLLPIPSHGMVQFTRGVQSGLFKGPLSLTVPSLISIIKSPTP